MELMSVIVVVVFLWFVVLPLFSAPKYKGRTERQIRRDLGDTSINSHGDQYD